MNGRSEETLFALALQKPADQRATFLDAVCEGDPALRRRLEALLGAHEHPSSSQATDSDSTTLHDTIQPNRTAYSADEAEGSLIGRYKLVERLGEGGFGAVWLAEQKEPVRRKMALKIIKLGMDTKSVVARFEAERQALAMMDHPNIAKVLDAGTTELGRPYFVMELVRGIPITKFCDGNHMPTKERLDLFIKVCQAIQHAHQKGIIHRDIKPSNVLVTLHDGVPVPKVIDFGIAKATQGELTDKTIHTQFQQFIGTPAYMSPEQAEMSGLDVDTRADIYSLGVLLYELLVGSTPFDAKELIASGLDAMRKTIREKEPMRPSTRLATLGGEELTTTAKRRAVDTSKLLHQLKGDLDWVAMKCLEKDRTRRYETANALAADLRRHLENEPVVARPPSAAYKFQKAFRRNRIAFGAASAVLLALLLGLGLALWQYAGKSRAEREQYRLREQAESRAREAKEAQEQAAQQRDLARERLYDSYLREARSIRKARQIGYRGEVFARLKDALALDIPRADPTLLRKEAAACVGDWVGLDPVDFEIPGDVFSDALAVDGTLVAIGAGDHRVSVRETRTGREAAAFEADGVPLSLAFDLKGIALFASVVDRLPGWGIRATNMHIEKWSLRGDGAWRQEWSKPKPSWFSCEDTASGPVSLALGPNDSYLAVEDLNTDAELARVPLEWPMAWRPMTAIRSDRRQLALLSRDTRSSFDVQLEVWDLDSKKRVAHVQPRLGPGWGLTYGWSGGTLAVTYDNTLIVHDTGQFGTSINMGGAFEGTYGGAIGGSSDGLLALPVIQELGVRVIQLGSGGELAYLKLPKAPVSSRFSADGSVLLLTHEVGARVVHLKLGKEKLLLEAHRGGVASVEFSPNGKELASTGKDRTLRIWNLSSPGASRLFGQLPAPGQTLAYTPDGQHLVCGCYNTAEMSVWSIADGKQVARISDDPTHSSTTWSSAISPDGRRLAAIGLGVRVWDLGRLLQSSNSPGWTDRPFISTTNGVSCLLLDAKGENLFYQDMVEGGHGNQAAPITVKNHSKIFRRSLDPGAQPSVIASDLQVNYVQAQCLLSKRGELAYINQNREIAIIQPSTGKLLRTFPTRERSDNSSWFVANLLASPDETKFALLTPSGLAVEIRDVTTGRLLYVLPEETGSIWWLAWHPDSQRLAVSRANGQIAIWNLSEVEAQLAKLGLKP